jgi:murein DD-endopeptidase MepM/ murein hydrolase activator NlpD
MAVAVIGAAACGAEQSLREALTPNLTPHERYAKRLRDAGLDSTAIGLGWLTAADSAIERPVVVPLPFRETGYLSPSEPRAVGYRVSLRRGEKLAVRLDLADSAGMQLFVDLYQNPIDTTEAPDHVATVDPTERALEYEARRDGEFLLRIQPELLRGGQYTLTLESGPSLAFPVSGRDSRAAQSFFGAARDGGRREHHGIDIFAPRGTPVLAAAPGIVRRVDVSNLGGKVVWLYDAKRGQSLYYAHLDSQIARPGALVEIGDTLGLVGNTGNARTTPPHLHFGIYRRGEGPVDPYPFVQRSRGSPARVVAATGDLGEWVRTSAATVTLRAAPADAAPALARLPRHTVVRLESASGAWYRARLPDGTSGWLSARFAESAQRPVGSERRTDVVTVRSLPGSAAPAMESVAPGTRVPVLGRFADYLYVQTPAGRTGWVAADDGAR